MDLKSKPRKIEKKFLSFGSIESLTYIAATSVSLIQGRRLAENLMGRQKMKISAHKNKTPRIPDLSSDIKDRVLVSLTYK